MGEDTQGQGRGGSADTTDPGGAVVGDRCSGRTPTSSQQGAGQLWKMKVTGPVLQDVRSLKSEVQFLMHLTLNILWQGVHPVHVRIPFPSSFAWTDPLGNCREKRILFNRMGPVDYTWMMSLKYTGKNGSITEQRNKSALLLVDNSVTLSQRWKGLKRQINGPLPWQE